MLGESVTKALGLDDTVFEFEITPNRPDCLSVIGLARETAASFELPLNLPAPPAREEKGEIENLLKVTIEDADLCPRYCAAMAKNIKIAPSPKWMRDRLREAGAEGVAVYSGTRYLLTEEFRLTEQDLLALFERHGYDLVLLEGFKSSGWPKIEVVRSAISDAPASFQPLAVVGDIPGADFDLNDIPALADWIEAQMPAL